MAAETLAAPFRPVARNLTGVRCESCGRGSARGVNAYEFSDGRMVVACYGCAARALAAYYGHMEISDE